MARRAELSHESFDVVVAGGGIAGFTLALALKTALRGRLSVAICDPALGSPSRITRRAYAVAAGPRRMYETLGVWDAIAGTAEPIRDMVITDSRTTDPVRPIFLTFLGDEAASPFAHMVETDHLTAAVSEAALAAGVVPFASSVRRRDVRPDGTVVRLADGTEISASLVAACDGARSRLRELAGIPMIGWSYDQSGIVATIGHERPHEGRAEEHFMPSGPFAVLPLSGDRSSIVWTERSDRVPLLLSLDADELLVEIEKRFGLHLGRLTLLDRPVAHPLAMKVARRFAADRLALVGDAAHVIHPIAGQGLNYGLRDVAALAEAVTDAAALGLDVGSFEILETYERARRPDTIRMAIVTDSLNRLFSNDILPVRLIRDLGLGIVDRLPSLKRRFIREAAGSEGLPRLMQGRQL
jgi:2-octaprenyl-6-methoxyphenol hydroxylase